MRLQRYLAQAGVASRRSAERLIREGRVAVNGFVVTAMGWKVDPQKDRVTVDGRPVEPAPGDAGSAVYILLHKPRGVLSAARDDRGRITAVEWVRRAGGPAVRVFPVGRLDLDSEGLLLLTNDGELAYALTHPSREVPKTYRVRVQGVLSDGAVEALRRGVMLEDGPAAAARVKVVRRLPESAEMEMVLYEGRKRQVRRMCRAVGLRVTRLVRTAVGPVRLGRLRPGDWRYLTAEEVERLRRAARVGERPAAHPFTPPARRGSIPPKTRQHGRMESGAEAP